MEKPDTQPDLTARIDEQLKATEGHSTAPWGLDEMVMRDCTGLGICHFYFRDENGSPVTPLFFDQDAALIASAPTLRALLGEARAQIAAQAEALGHAQDMLGLLDDGDLTVSRYITVQGKDKLRHAIGGLREGLDTLGARQ